MIREFVGFIVGAIVVAAVLFGAAVSNSTKPPKPDEVKPGMIPPGTALIAGGEIQATWMKLGTKTRLWVNEAKDAKSVVELVVENGVIQVVKDGRQGAGVAP